MNLDRTYNFANEHLNDNTDKLLLNKKSFPDVDMPVAVTQIHARRAIKDKLPKWYTNNELRYPSKLSTEQCSSEITAKYKATLFIGETLCDLTGGLGVDCIAFSLLARQVNYYERYPEYCQAAKHNFSVLGRDNITVHNSDFREVINEINADTLYIDPARRGNNLQRLFSLSDYEPNILEIKEELLSRCKRLIVKISPMADISAVCREIPEISEIHIVSVKNECKEILLVVEKGNTNAIRIITINFDSNNNVQQNEFIRTDEYTPFAEYATATMEYLYEPNASIMKSGAFNQLARQYNINPLSRNSHLYTSDQHITEFPGRVFHVIKTHIFTSKWAKGAKQLFPKANITVRNFPLSVAELRKSTKIAEGGDIYLFATTTTENQKVIIECKKG